MCVSQCVRVCMCVTVCGCVVCVCVSITGDSECLSLDTTVRALLSKPVALGGMGGETELPVVVAAYDWLYFELGGGNCGS